MGDVCVTATALTDEQRAKSVTAEGSKSHVKSRVEQRALGAVKKLLRDERREKGSDSVFVGVSGGADSLALAVLVSKVAPKLGMDWHAVIVDHQLQTNSAEVSSAAAEKCRCLRATGVHVEKVHIEGSNNLEAKAREARFEAFGRVVTRVRGGSVASAGSALLLAHTLDDQAETVLLGLARSSGTSAIKGIAPRSRFETSAATLNILRPLLSFTRSDTEEICRVNHLEWWDDPTNKGTSLADPARSRLRAKVLPELEHIFPGIRQNLARTAELASADLDFLEGVASRAVAALTASSENADINARTAEPELNIKRLRELPDAIRFRVIRNWLFLHAKSPRTKQLPIERILEIDNTLVLNRGHGGLMVQLEGGIKVVREGNLLKLRT